MSFFVKPPANEWHKMSQKEKNEITEENARRQALVDDANAAGADHDKLEKLSRALKDAPTKTRDAVKATIEKIVDAALKSAAKS